MNGRNFIALLMLALLLGKPAAADYTFGVQPVLSPEQTRKSYEPLRQYLEEILEEPVKLVTQPDFLHYGLRYDNLKTYDFTLDAAHLAAARSGQRRGDMLAKVEGRVSYTLVTSSDSDVVEAKDLIGRRIATLSAPSMGAVALAQMFNNPVRQPKTVEVATSADALRWLREGLVDAAIVPTPLLGNSDALIPVLQTELFPHMVFSASKKVPKRVQTVVRRALLSAKLTFKGKQMLSAIQFPGFERVDPQEYIPYASLVQRLWRSDGRSSERGSGTPSFVSVERETYSSYPVSLVANVSIY